MQDGTGKLPTPDSQVDNEYDTETMVYNRKRNGKKREEQKKKKKQKTKRIREVEEIQQQKERKNPKPLIILLGHN